MPTTATIIRLNVPPADQVQHRLDGCVVDSVDVSEIIVQPAANA